VMAARHRILLQQQPELHALDPSQLVPALGRYDCGVVDRRFQRSKLEPKGSKPTARKERRSKSARAHLHVSPSHSISPVEDEQRATELTELASHPFPPFSNIQS